MKRYKRGKFYYLGTTYWINIYKDGYGKPCIFFEGMWFYVFYSKRFKHWELECDKNEK